MKRQVLVCLGLMLLQAGLIGWVYGWWPEWFSNLDASLSLQPVGWLIEWLVFVGLFLLLLVLFGHPWRAFLLANVLYWVWQLASAFKMSFLNAPIVYYDLYHVDDLIRNWEVLAWTHWLLLMLLLGTILAFVWWAWRHPRPGAVRSQAAVLLLLAVGSAVWQKESIKQVFIDHKIKYKWNSNITVKAQKFGFSSVFIQSVFFSSALQRPAGYSPDQVAQWQQSMNAAPATAHEQQPDNVIVLLIESFQDTATLPWAVQPEPTPTYQNMKQQQAITGQVLAPVFGGKSVNSEFELLTGFSHALLPSGSIAYKDFVKQAVPSLAWQFKQHDYRTNVIQVVAMHGYGYETIYQHLGFDHQFSLSRHDPQVPLDPSGRFGSSQAIAQQITELLSSQQRSFVFAFPNSSHAPWDLNDYPDSPFQVAVTGAVSMQQELEAYFNALNHLDQLFKALVDWANNSDEHTVILILGDHQPALQANDPSRHRTNPQSAYTVPYLLWSNQAMAFSSTGGELISMNMLAPFLLQQTGLTATGWFDFLQQLMPQYRVLSSEVLTKTGEGTAEQGAKVPLIEQYQMLQYHHMSGE